MAKKLPGKYPYGYTGSGWRYPVGHGAARTFAPRRIVAGGGGGGGGGGAPADAWTGLIKDVRKQIAQLGHPNIKKDPTLLAWQAERKSLADEIAAEQVRMTKEANRAGNYALALTRLNQGNDEDVAAQYQNAAAQIQGLGAGLTGGVRDVYQQQADASAAAVNATMGGRAPDNAAIAGFNPEALSNTSQYTGVTIPATSFAEESARSASDAAGRATEAGWNIMGIQDEYRQKAIDERIKSGLEVKKLLAQRPALVAKIQATYKTDRQNAIKILATIVNQRETAKREAAAQKAYSEYLKSGAVQRTADVTGKTPSGGPTLAATTAQHDYDVKIAAANAATAKERSAKKLAQGRLAASYTSTNKYQTDWRGKPIPDAQGRKQPIGGYKLDAKGNVVKGYAPGSGTDPTKPPSYTDINKMQTSMAEGIRTKFNLDSQFPTKTEANKPIWSRKRIAAWLMRQYGSPFLIRYPGQGKAVRGMADEIANTVYADLVKRKRDNG